MVLFSSRKGAKDAKIFQNIPFAFLAAWREKIITQEVNDIRKGAEGRFNSANSIQLYSFQVHIVNKTFNERN